MKNKLISTLCASLIVCGTLSTAMAEIPRPAKPNIVLILTDDLGWQDVGCYDVDEPSPYETPNIDQLAKEGFKFWQAYSPAPTCAPSRVAILSGNHPARSQKTHVVGGGPPAPYKENSAVISPWYSGRMNVSEITIAEALKTNGYTTGAVGKWHCAISHHAFPQPTDQGFDFARMDIGVTAKMKPHRLTGFATSAKDDPYRLDGNGIPRHQNSIDARDFVEQHKGDPFFLYYCTWLVHTPIHSRTEALLRKYCEKLGVPFPTDPKGWAKEGQKNPYYAAMVELLDHYVGELLTYLRQTDDPRWPGHKLVENTYIIFTSDNGGMEQHPGEVITDNYPLDKGKINAKEGGVRVPLIITGPGLKSGAESDAMINGLDFYPTILSWTGTSKPETQQLDGLDLAPFLKSDLTDSDLIAGADGKPRDAMVWHFPHSSMQSTIRQGRFKLIRNWSQYLLPNRPALELYELYDASGERVDIEESKNLAESMPEKARDLNTVLQTHLDEMQASPPFLNPTCKAKLFAKDKVCTAQEHGRQGNDVWVTYRENGAKVVDANLIYTDNGNHKYEEWYRLPAKVAGGNKVTARLPNNATHYVFNLIDENHFLVSYPRVKTQADTSEPYSAKAISAK
ncbi:sulfatase [Planctomycetes bacterium K23_9]|uniref:Arylsulfatase n=1 Tax=Stieleria marina TaxID=1930275 RepID=A0A517NRB2_9BACT|nr:Arylsulfatase [Planctomycetes bacterium K23_9]